MLNKKLYIKKVYLIWYTSDNQPIDMRGKNKKTATNNVIPVTKYI